MPKLKVDAIERQIKALMKTIKQYIPEVCEVHTQEGTHITQLMIRGFHGIIASCKEELEDSDEEHLKFVLLSMCRIDVDALSDEALYQAIDDFISNYINPSAGMSEDFLELNEKNILIMIQLQKYTQDALRALESQIKTMGKNRLEKWWFRKELKEIKGYHKELSELFDALNARVEIDADKMIERIVDNFYMIFIFFLALSKLTHLQSDIIENIVILSEIDRILDIIDPSLQGNTLKNKYLLYYHVIFELKEFRHTLLAKI